MQKKKNSKSWRYVPFKPIRTENNILDFSLIKKKLRNIYNMYLVLKNIYYENRHSTNVPNFFLYKKLWYTKYYNKICLKTKSF